MQYFSCIAIQVLFILLTVFSCDSISLVNGWNCFVLKRYSGKITFVMTCDAMNVILNFICNRTVTPNFISCVQSFPVLFCSILLLHIIFCAVISSLSLTCAQQLVINQFSESSIIVCCLLCIVFHQIIRNCDQNHFLMRTSVPCFPKITCFSVVFST